MKLDLSPEETKEAKEWRKNKVNELKQKVRSGQRLEPMERSFLKMWGEHVGKE